MSAPNQLFQSMLSSEIKGDLLVLFHKNPGLIDSLDGVARRIGRIGTAIQADVQDKVNVQIIGARQIQASLHQPRLATGTRRGGAVARFHHQGNTATPDGDRLAEPFGNVSSPWGRYEEGSLQDTQLHQDKGNQPLGHLGDTTECWTSFQCYRCGNELPSRLYSTPEICRDRVSDEEGLGNNEDEG